LFFSGLDEKSSEQSIGLSEYFVKLKELFSIPNTWVLISATFFAGFAFKGISGVDSAALVTIGVPEGDRSFLFAVLIPALMLIGALVGGYCSDKWNKQRALNWFILFSSVMSLFYGLIFDVLETGWIMYLVVSLFYLGIGLITASLYAYLMGHTKKMFAAFEFSLFMAAINMSESVCTWFSGAYSEEWGFTLTVLPQVIFALIAIWCLRWVAARETRQLV